MRAVDFDRVEASVLRPERSLGEGLHDLLDLIERNLADVIAGTERRLDFPFMFRYNADDGVPNGITIGEARRFALMLEEAGVDAHHVSASIGESWEMCEPPIYVERGSLVHLAAAVKEVAHKPVIAVGGIDIPLAAQVVREGKADIIAMGRGFLADPYLPDKAALS
jgi:2,4-dienoyl-CoA reductase-like NADH-dependent reductase (Old Yellow Enzyme family)